MKEQPSPNPVNSFLRVCLSAGVFRITGWDGWTRQTGSVEITP